jgi:hypothetical protein
MIPEVILDVILDVILHGFVASRRGSIRPWDRIVGLESIMSKSRSGATRTTRYIVCKQAVSTATGTNRHVPPILRLR